MWSHLLFLVVCQGSNPITAHSEFDCRAEDWAARLEQYLWLTMHVTDANKQCAILLSAVSSAATWEPRILIEESFADITKLKLLVMPSASRRVAA